MISTSRLHDAAARQTLPSSMWDYYLVHCHSHSFGLFDDQVHSTARAPAVPAQCRSALSFADVGLHSCWQGPGRSDAVMAADNREASVQRQSRSMHTAVPKQLSSQSILAKADIHVAESELGQYLGGAARLRGIVRLLGGRDCCCASAAVGTASRDCCCCCGGGANSLDSIADDLWVSCSANRGTAGSVRSIACFAVHNGNPARQNVL